MVSGDPFIAFGANSRVAVADGKEIAANTIQCAAEAESLLAKAERVKAKMWGCGAFRRADWWDGRATEQILQSSKG